MEWIKQRKSMKVYGTANVKVGRSKTVAVMDSTHREYEFENEELPKGLTRSGNYSVCISGKGDKMFSAYPSKATVQFRYKGMVTKKDQPPTPRHVTGEREGKNGPYTVDEFRFTTINEIVGGDFDGMEFTASFVYSKFDQGDDGEVIVTGTSKDSERLVQYMEVMGALSERIEFSENILPKLDEIFKKKRKLATVVISNGWPDSYGAPISIGSRAKSNGKHK